MDWIILLLIIGGGILAGFINTLAGSGSLISLPILIFTGIPADIANGTNRVAIFIQNLVSSGSFKKHKVLDTATGFRLAIPAVIGSIAGALVAVDLNAAQTEKVIGVVLLVMLVSVVLKPSQWTRAKSVRGTRWLDYVIFLFIGFYAGFIQAGVGFLFLAALVLNNGYDLVRANALKVFINLLTTALALVIFIWSSRIDWYAGIALAGGNAVGAWVGANMAIRYGTGFIRWILLAALGMAAAKLLFF
jgi:uncharacterized membrane protein YfcA